MTTEDNATLMVVFGKVARLLGALPSDEERARVLAAVICLLEDDQDIARAVVKRYATREEG